MPLPIARPFDPFGTITKALWKMRSYTLPENKPLGVEDVIQDILNEDICKERREKWQEIADLKKDMKDYDPSFKGFYLEENYWEKFDKCIENFDAIVASVLEEVKNRAAPWFLDENIVLEVDDKDHLESSSWAQRKKKQKIIEIP